MRAIALVSISALILSGCLTSQENPNYEFSSRYEGDAAATHQFANAEAAPMETTAVTYETTPAQPVFLDDTTIVSAPAPTDTDYAAQQMTGTPGFMAMQGEVETAQAQIQSYAGQDILITNGTAVEYDMSQNLVVAESGNPSALIVADTVSPVPLMEETVRVLPSAGALGQAYKVQPGDTVYSLSRKTCVGVNVIQSMNGLGGDYAIKIGQTITLPASVC